MALTINKQPDSGSLVLCNSPILIQASSTNVSNTDFKFECEVYIWTGLSSAMPSDPSYTLRKLPNTSMSNRAVFDISKLFLDEISLPQMNDWTNRVVESTGTAVWGKVVCKGVWDGGSESTTGNGFYVTNGYSFTYDQTINYNYDHDDRVGLIDTPEDMYVFGDSMYVPVYRAHHNAVTVRDGVNSHTEDISAKSSGQSSQRLVHVDILDICENEGVTGDNIEVTLNGTNNVTFKFIRGCATKFTAYPVAYVNKFGVIQYAFFEGRTNKTMNVTSEQHQRAMFYDGFNLDMSKNTGSAYNHNAKIQYEVNTGIMSEDFNTNIEQLLLSPKIMIYADGTWRSVNVLDQSITFKTSLNDKMIQYALQLQETANYINSANA